MVGAPGLHGLDAILLAPDTVRRRTSGAEKGQELAAQRARAAEARTKQAEAEAMARDAADAALAGDSEALAASLAAQMEMGAARAAEILKANMAAAAAREEAERSRPKYGSGVLRGGEAKLPEDKDPHLEQRLERQRLRSESADASPATIE